LIPAFCITLGGDRAWNASREFQAAGIDVKMFEGFDGRKLGLSPATQHTCTKRMQVGEIGNCLSHLALWRALMIHPGEEFIIFEDDAILCPNFLGRLDEVFKALPDDWQLCFLGHLGGREIEAVNSVLSTWERPLTTFAYIVNKSGLRALIDSNRTLWAAIDVQSAVLSYPSMRVYCCSDPIATHPKEFVSAVRGPVATHNPNLYGDHVLSRYRARVKTAYAGLGLDSNQAPMDLPYVIEKCIAGARFDFIIGNGNGRAWYDKPLNNPASSVQCERWTEIEFIKDRILKPGMVVFDVGAHQGFYSMCFAQFVGPSGRVFSFEPFPQNHDLITANAELNDATNLTIVPSAVGESNGSVEMSNSGQKVGAGGFVVNCVRIDSMPTAADFIKIDVEGYEAAVLRGAKDTLEYITPHLAIEIHQPMIGKAGVDEVLSLVDWSKYDCTHVVNGEFLPWQPGVEINQLTTLYAVRKP
jgi:FkbM family methyltransferase